MKRTSIITGLYGALSVLALFSLSPRPSAAQTANLAALLTSDFEQTRKPWQAGADAPAGQYALTREQDDNGCSDGGHAYANLQLNVSPAYHLAGVWMVAPVTISGANQVVLDWRASDKTGADGPGLCRSGKQGRAR